METFYGDPQYKLPAILPRRSMATRYWPSLTSHIAASTQTQPRTVAHVHVVKIFPIILAREENADPESGWTAINLSTPHESHMLNITSTVAFAESARLCLGVAAVHTVFFSVGQDAHSEHLKYFIVYPSNGSATGANDWTIRNPLDFLVRDLTGEEQVLYGPVLLVRVLSHGYGMIELGDIPWAHPNETHLHSWFQTHIRARLDAAANQEMAVLVHCAEQCFGSCHRRLT